MAGGGFTVDTKAFLSALPGKLHELRDQDGAAYLHELGTAGANIARSRAPRGATGGIASGIGITAGRDAHGPYVDWGVINPPPRREDFFMEMGTFKDRPQPFMRPAMAALTGGVAGAGGKARRVSSVRSRGVALRARKRGLIRTFRRRGGITAGEARSVSRQVSSRFQLRQRRGRAWISNTRIRGRG